MSCGRLRVQHHVRQHLRIDLASAQSAHHAFPGVGAESSSSASSTRLAEGEPWRVSVYMPSAYIAPQYHTQGALGMCSDRVRRSVSL